MNYQLAIIDRVQNLPFELAIHVVFLQQLRIVGLAVATCHSFVVSANLVEFLDPLQSLCIFSCFKLAVGPLLMPQGKGLQSDGVQGFSWKCALIELQHVVEIPDTVSHPRSMAESKGQNMVKLWRYEVLHVNHVTDEANDIAAPQVPNPSQSSSKWRPIWHYMRRCCIMVWIPSVEQGSPRLTPRKDMEQLRLCLTVELLILSPRHHQVWDAAARLIDAVLGAVERVAVVEILLAVRQSHYIGSTAHRKAISKHCPLIHEVLKLGALSDSKSRHIICCRFLHQHINYVYIYIYIYIHTYILYIYI